MTVSVRPHHFAAEDYIVNRAQKKLPVTSTKSTAAQVRKNPGLAGDQCVRPYSVCHPDDLGQARVPIDAIVEEWTI